MPSKVEEHEMSSLRSTARIIASKSGHVFALVSLFCDVLLLVSLGGIELEVEVLKIERPSKLPSFIGPIKRRDPKNTIRDDVGFLTPSFSTHLPRMCL